MRDDFEKIVCNKVRKLHSLLLDVAFFVSILSWLLWWWLFGFFVQHTLNLAVQCYRSKWNGFEMILRAHGSCLAWEHNVAHRVPSHNQRWLKVTKGYNKWPWILALPGQVGHPLSAGSPCHSCDWQLQVPQTLVMKIWTDDQVREITELCHAKWEGTHLKDWTPERIPEGLKPLWQTRKNRKNTEGKTLLASHPKKLLRKMLQRLTYYDAIKNRGMLHVSSVLGILQLFG